MGVPLSYTLIFPNGDVSMSETTRCILCGSAELEQVDAISVTDIAKLYKKYKVTGIRRIYEGLETVSFVHCSTCDLFFFFPTVQAPESLYGSLQQFPWYYFDEKHEFGFARQFIGTDDDVLEIGAGKGAFAKLIQPGKYTGLELSDSAIEKGSKNGVSISNEMVEDYALRNPNLHDVVCCFQVLEHVGDVRRFLESSVATLKIGGMLIVSVPSEDCFINNKINGTLNIPPHHVTRWTDRCLANMAGILNLDIVAIETEMLSKVHVYSYHETSIMKRIYSILGRKRRLVDTSLLNKFIRIVSFCAAKLLIAFSSSDSTGVRGHSVTCVYRKR